MKSRLYFFITAMVMTGPSFAQINIGSVAAPNADAMLQVSSTSKGLLLPNIALTGTASPSPMSAFVSGMTVYNTATAGTGPNNVTPGYYYSDGTKWIKLAGVQDQTNTVTGLAAGLTSPVAAATFDAGSFELGSSSKDNTNYIYINDADGTTWTYNATAGNYRSFTAQTATPWYLSGGTADAGANKTGNIYRTGKVGINQSNPQRMLDVNAGSSPLRITNLPSLSGSSNGYNLVLDTATGDLYKSLYVNTSGQFIRVGINGQSVSAGTEVALRFNSCNTTAEMGTAPNSASNFYNTITNATVSTEGVSLAAGNGVAARTTDRIFLPAGVYKVTVTLVTTSALGSGESFGVKIATTNTASPTVTTASNEYVNMVDLVNPYGGAGQQSAILSLNNPSYIDFLVAHGGGFFASTIEDYVPITGGNVWRSTISIERLQ